MELLTVLVLWLILVLIEMVMLFQLVVFQKILILISSICLGMNMLTLYLV